MDAEIQQALQGLTAPPTEPSTHSDHIAQLAHLIDGELALQPFLEQLLPQLCTLFSGAAAVVWMKAHGAQSAIVGVRYQMDRLLPAATDQRQHQRLVQLAWRQPQPLLIEGHQPPHSLQDSSLDGPLAAVLEIPPNPTGHPLLFAPVIHHSETLALIEIALGSGPADLSPTDLSPAQRTSAELTPAQRQLYIRASGLVARRLAGGLSDRIHPAPPSVDRAIAQLESLSGEVMDLQQQIRQRFDQRLQQFAGWAFATLADKQAFAKRVQQLLEGHGLRVACAECGHPAILRAVAIGNAKHGAFVFDHYLDSGRTFHGGSTTVPLVYVVSKPARRAAKIGS